jgi:hypothetical protein
MIARIALIPLLLIAATAAQSEGLNTSPAETRAIVLRCGGGLDGDQYEVQTNSAHYSATYYGRCFSDHPRPQICQHGSRTTGDLDHYIEFRIDKDDPSWKMRIDWRDGFSVYHITQERDGKAEKVDAGFCRESKESAPLSSPFLPAPVPVRQNADTTYTPRAEIKVVAPETDAHPAVVTVSGQFRRGDNLIFFDAVEKIHSATVYFDSPGGSTFAGIGIGEIIHERGFHTAVINYGKCTSACALAWLGGRERYLGGYAEIYFHHPFFAKGTILDETQTARAMEYALHIIDSYVVSSITVREENAAAALEVMVRFAVDPRWLIYLPPTMSPSETSERDGYLEHPAEAIDFYKRSGMKVAICEEKHMGSRAVLVVAQDPEVARRRFGVTSGEQGMIYTRTGRQFFAGRVQTQAAVARAATALEVSGLFRDLDTDWVCLDAEIMPWSAKAQSLIEQQYGPVGAAARTGLALAQAAAKQAVARGVDVGALPGVLGARAERVERFSAAVRQYCWPVTGLDGVKIAPFHILAAEGRVFSSEPHTWHMVTLARLAEHDVLFQVTRTREVDLDDASSIADAVGWWAAMTEAYGEGMVVKPPTVLARTVATEKGPGRIVQPAIKCRGRDYLRIIYGPDYDAPEHLARLRKRGLGAKRSLAIREFTLGLEALDRFVAREPLRRVHECVFAVLALESEPVDPRL